MNASQETVPVPKNPQPTPPVPENMPPKSGEKHWDVEDLQKEAIQEETDLLPSRNKFGVEEGLDVLDVREPHEDNLEPGAVLDELKVLGINIDEAPSVFDPQSETHPFDAETELKAQNTRQGTDENHVATPGDALGLPENESPQEPSVGDEGAGRVSSDTESAPHDTPQETTPTPKENLSEGAEVEEEIPPKTEVSGEVASKFQEGFALTAEDIAHIEGFADLSEGQQQLVVDEYQKFAYEQIETGKHRRFNEERQQSGVVGRLGKSMFKEMSVAAARKREAQHWTKGTSEADKKMKRDALKVIVSETRESGIDAVKKEDGTLEIQYLPESKYSDPIDREMVQTFNKIAHEYAQFSHEDARKDPQGFASIKSRYDRAVAQVFAQMEGSEEKEILLERLRVDSVIESKRFVDSDPEAEKELARSGGRLGLFSGFAKDVRERGGYMAAGVAARSLAGKSFEYIALPVLGAFPVVSAGMGAWLAHVRGKKEMGISDELARAGVEDRSDEKFKTTVQRAQRDAEGNIIKDEHGNDVMEQKRVLMSNEQVTSKNVVNADHLITRLEGFLDMLGSPDDDLGEMENRAVRHKDGEFEGGLDAVRDEAGNIVHRHGAAQGGVTQEAVSKRDTVVASLEARIDYTQRKISEGLVNLGKTPAEQRENMYRLTKSLAQAVAIREAQRPVVKNFVRDRINNVLDIRGRKIDMNRKKKLREYAWKGGLISAGFSGLGIGIGQYIATGSMFGGLFEKGSGTSGGAVISEAHADDEFPLDREIADMRENDPADAAIDKQSHEIVDQLTDRISKHPEEASKIGEVIKQFHDIDQEQNSQKALEYLKTEAEKFTKVEVEGAKTDGTQIGVESDGESDAVPESDQEDHEIQGDTTEDSVTAEQREVDQTTPKEPEEINDKNEPETPEEPPAQPSEKDPTSAQGSTETAPQAQGSLADEILAQHEVKKGENLTNILKENIPELTDLQGGQVDNAVENFFAAHGKDAREYGISSGDIHDIRPGEEIDLEKMRADFLATRVDGEDLITHAKNLSQEKVANIEKNNRSLEYFAGKNPDVKLTPENTKEILEDDDWDALITGKADTSQVADATAPKEGYVEDDIAPSDKESVPAVEAPTPQGSPTEATSEPQKEVEPVPSEDVEIPMAPHTTAPPEQQPAENMDQSASPPESPVSKAGASGSEAVRASVLTPEQKVQFEKTIEDDLEELGIPLEKWKGTLALQPAQNFLTPENIRTPGGADVSGGPVFDQVGSYLGTLQNSYREALSSAHPQMSAEDIQKEITPRYIARGNPQNEVTKEYVMRLLRGIALKEPTKM